MKRKKESVPDEDEETEKIRVNIFDYEVIDVCGGRRLRRKFTGRQHIFELRKREEIIMETSRRGLPQEVTESEWYKNLPEANWKGMLEDYREKLEEAGVDLDSLDRKYLSFVVTLMGSWKFFETILPLKKIFEHLDEAWQTSESCFNMGLGDMSMNAEIAVKDIRKAHYSG